jgi:hypothetical protein
VLSVKSWHAGRYRFNDLLGGFHTLHQAGNHYRSIQYGAPPASVQTNVERRRRTFMETNSSVVEMVSECGGLWLEGGGEWVTSGDGTPPKEWYVCCPWCTLDLRGADVNISSGGRGAD